MKAPDKRCNFLEMHRDELSKDSEVYPQLVVCILGMHRSGTSLLSRILNLMGVYLGSQEAVTTEAAMYNPTGHWEHKEITSICDGIIKRYGGSWDEPPSFPDEWHTSRSLDDLRNQATRLLQNQFGNANLWGWKDPRTCLTLPFWQQLVPGMRYIICLRNPVDVALSLAHRDSFSVEKSSYLWLEYVVAALNHTEHQSRLIIFYEDLIDDCSRELERLARFLGIGEGAEQLELIQKFTDTGLQHHRTSLTQTIANSRPELYARALYILQRLSVDLDPEDHSNQANSSIQALESLNRNFQAFIAVETSFTKHEKTLVKLDQTISIQLDELCRALQIQSTDATERVRSLSSQLLQSHAQLPPVKDKWNRRLLTRYRHTKDYLTPIYRRMGQALTNPKEIKMLRKQ